MVVFESDLLITVDGSLRVLTVFCLAAGLGSDWLVPVFVDLRLVGVFSLILVVLFKGLVTVFVDRRFAFVPEDCLSVDEFVLVRVP